MRPRTLYAIPLVQVWSIAIKEYTADELCNRIKTQLLQTVGTEETRLDHIQMNSG